MYRDKFKPSVRPKKEKPRVRPLPAGGNVFPKDVTVDTSAVKLDEDTPIREQVTILADGDNTDEVLIGNSIGQRFPLVAGASLTLLKVSVCRVYARAVSGTQTLHVIVAGV